MRVRAGGAPLNKCLLQRLRDAVDVGGFDATPRAAVGEQFVQRVHRAARARGSGRPAAM